MYILNISFQGGMSSRAELLLREADKMNCRAFVQVKDVASGHQKLNLAFVANLFKNFPALEQPEEVEEVAAETREEKSELYTHGQQNKYT